MVRFFRRKQETESPPETAPAETVGLPAPPLEEEPADVEHAVERIRRTWFGRITGMFRRGLGDELWEELEETLVAADTGVETTTKVLDGLRERVKSEGIRDPEQAQE